MRSGTRGRVWGTLASTLVLLGLLGGTPACGMLSAITNPGAAFALNEPAPMSIVVRRAEVANATAHEIERVIGEAAFGPKAKWVDRVTIAKADAEVTLKAAGNDPIYAMTQTRVMPAEAWLIALAGVCDKDDEHASLMAALGDEADEKYAEIVSQGAALADLREQLAKEEAALDDEKLDAKAKEGHTAAKTKLEADIEKANETFEPKRAAMVALVGTAAGKVKGPLADRMKLAVVNLRRAVEDARMANATAMLRYPLAMPGMTTDVQTSAKRFAADSVEEQIGSRPDLSTLSPDVKLEGTDVKLVLNGIPADKIGSISPTELIAETTSRTKDYVERVLTLLAYGSETTDLLAFEADLLDAWITGLGADANMAEATNISDVTVAVAPAAPGAKSEAAKPAGPRTTGGLAVASCKAKKKKKKPAPEPVEEAVVAEKKDEKAGAKKDAKADAKKPAAKEPAKPAARPEKQATKPASPPAPAKPATPAPAAAAPKKPAAPAAAPAGGEDCMIQVVRNGVKVCL